VDSKKIKIIIAAALGGIVLIVIAMTVFGGNGGDKIDQAALDKLQDSDEPIRGGPRMAPGYDPSDDP